MQNEEHILTKIRCSSLREKNLIFLLLRRHFDNNPSRKDLIHLNRSGLRLIKELIEDEIDRQKEDQSA